MIQKELSSDRGISDQDTNPNTKYCGDTTPTTNKDDPQCSPNSEIKTFLYHD